MAIYMKINKKIEILIGISGLFIAVTGIAIPLYSTKANIENQLKLEARETYARHLREREISIIRAKCYLDQLENIKLVEMDMVKDIADNYSALVKESTSNTESIASAKHWTTASAKSLLEDIQKHDYNFSREMTIYIFNIRSSMSPAELTKAQAICNA